MSRPAGAPKETVAPVPAAAGGERGRGPLGHGPPAADDDHPVGHALGLGQLVGGEQHAHPAPGQAGHHVAHRAAAPRGRRRPSARRGRPPRAGPPGPGPGRAAAARRPRGGATGWPTPGVSDTRSSRPAAVLGVVVVGGEQVEHPAGPEHRVDPAALEHHPDAGHQRPVVAPRVEAQDPHPARRRAGGSPRGSRRWRSSPRRWAREWPAPRRPRRGATARRPRWWPRSGRPDRSTSTAGAPAGRSGWSGGPASGCTLPLAPE